MKKVPIFTVLMFLVFCLFAGSSFAQTETGSWQNQIEWRGNNTSINGDFSTMVPQRGMSAQEMALENRIMEIKRTGNGTNDEISQLQKQIDQMNGLGATVQSVPMPGSGVVEATNQPPFQGGDINVTTIINTGTKLVSGMATFTEQTGVNAGRLWALVAFRTTSAPDSLRLYSSDNDGINWTLRALAWLGGTDRINYEQMDMEVITSGDSTFVWAFYGYRPTGGTGDWRVGGMVIRTNPVFGGSLFAMSWPGTSSNNRYYRPRVTSDNAQWPTFAYLYIVASYDSVTSAPAHRNGQKYARVLNPYVTSGATFSYYGPVYFWNTTTSDGNLRDLHSDIAYFVNGGNDSIITSYSNMRDSTAIFFAKSGIGTPAPYGAAGFVTGTQTTHKQYASLSTNSNANGSVYCIFRQYVSGSEWDVKYFRTTNYGNFNSITGQSVLLPRSSTTVAYAPYIMGVRNGTSHYFAFRVDSSPDSLAYTQTTVGGAWPVDNVNMSNVTTLSGTVFPKPSFRFTNNDSCFVIYPDTGPFDMLASSSCTGTITNITNNQIPGAYKLSQNYPNPFNPSTSIRFEIPKAGFVKLVIYDVLGKEVATLINDRREAGAYLVDFNASGLSSGVYFYKLVAGDFSEIKKMTLIK